MNKSFTLRFNFALIVAIMSFGLGILYIPIQQNQNAFGSYDSTSNPSSTSSGTSGGTMNSTNNDNISIALSVKDAGGIYKWTNATSGLENPELNLKADVNNIIQIQNPTNTKHELVIDSQGKEVATSGDIAPGASGQASFRPNGTGLFSYHCEYHPDTMKGTIKLTSQ
jgi:Cupredoxin-like domain